MKRYFILFSILILLCCTACSAGKTAEEPVPSPVLTVSPTEEPAPSAPTPSPAPTDASGEKETIHIDLGTILSMHLGTDRSAYAVLPLPESSSELSMELAMEALTLCTGHDRDTEAALLQDAGFTVLLQTHYDKADSDTSHTCAYTVGRQEILYGGEARTLLIVAIRGTNAGEWYSNFDFAPSHNAATVSAENFLMAAEDVFMGLQALPELEQNPLVLVCGHSRGAACANLLGRLLNETLGSANVFTYTFATPATIRGNGGDDCDNIFNFININDIVTMVPLSAWGYTRVGTDILLGSTGEETQQLQTILATLNQLAPGIAEYYQDRHSLTGSGLSSDGMTAYEMMQFLAGALSDTTALTESGEALLPVEIAPDSDFYPLSTMLTALSADNGAAGMLLLMQHMPSTYASLMEALSVQD